jgi:small subunit ribosomal protein S6
MFLFDNAAVHEWSDMEAEVRRLFERIEAEPLVCVKFDERKLAYEIKGRKRGTYVLTYFDAGPQRITDLERDAQLSELILRVLVLRADKLTEERLAELKAHAPEQPLQPMSSEGRRGEAGGRGRSEPAAKSDAGVEGAKEPESVATATAPTGEVDARPDKGSEGPPTEPASAED